MLACDAVRGLSQSFDREGDKLRSIFDQYPVGYARVCADLAGHVGFEAVEPYVDHRGILCDFQFDNNIWCALERGDFEEARAWGEAWPFCASKFLLGIANDAVKLCDRYAPDQAKRLLDEAAAEVGRITQKIRELLGENW